MGKLEQGQDERHQIREGSKKQIHKVMGFMFRSEMKEVLDKLDHPAEVIFSKNHPNL